MKSNRRRILWFGAAVGILLWAAGFYKVSEKLTYIERIYMNEESVQNIPVTDQETILEQEFAMPYELFWSVEIKIGTYGRNNNSFWRVELREAENGETVYRWDCNASQVSDGEYYSFQADSPVPVGQGKKYKVAIVSKDADGNSALAFYTSKADVYEEGKLFLNGLEQEGDLCMRVTGGEKDPFWGGLYVGATLLLLGIAVWCAGRVRCGKPIRPLVEAVGVSCVYLVLMYIFSRNNMGNFTDECDNIRGGMLIAKGRVLYRDYYTQHTPFGYYLCGLFALLGAGSVQQFRLLYYLTTSIVWGGLYYRHSRFFGKKRMLLLLLAQVWIIMPMFFQASKILGDNIQGICMVALVMEFLRYWEDGELGRGRSLLAAACIFISIASAFVSVFALVPIVAGVLAREGILWKRKGGFTLAGCAKRYGCLAAATAAPFGAALLYFAYMDAAKKMYRMAYQFNTMVYNKYQNEYGRIKWKPFFLGIRNYFESISSNFNTMITAAGNDTAVIQCLLAVLAVASLLYWGVERKKREDILAVAALFLCMCGNGTRGGTDFHAIGLWEVALTIILLMGMDGDMHEKWKGGKGTAVVLAALGCYLLQPYVAMVADHIVYHPDIVEGVDEEIVAATEAGEGIFLDAYAHDSIYLLYKGRYPVNRNCYLLPWYMDWFEQDTIDDLEASMPAILVYRPEMEVYGAKDFCPRLDQVIQNNYVRSEEGSILWKLK